MNKKITRKVQIFINNLPNRPFETIEIEDKWESDLIKIVKYVIKECSKIPLNIKADTKEQWERQKLISKKIEEIL